MPTPRRSTGYSPTIQSSPPVWPDAPGRRVPRTVDGDELAVRAVLGQQVSTAAARTAAGALVAAWGEPLSRSDRRAHPPVPLGRRPGRRGAGPPGGRTRTLALLVDELVGGRLDLGPGADREHARHVVGLAARHRTLDRRDGGHAGAR